MTTYGAYDKGLPCKNPSCKSNGKPHPNCRCYGPMAKGGKVESFCAKAQAHKPECEYYADGGEVLEPTPMPSAGQIVPDMDSGAEVPIEPAPQVTRPTDDEPLPAFEDTIHPDDEPLPSFEDTVHPDEYTSSEEMVGAGVEGVARGILGPIAPAIEIGLSELGVPGFSAEDQARRQRLNPKTAMAGEGIGLGASLLVGGPIIAAATKTAQAVANVSRLGATGQTILKGALSSGLLQGSDEITRAMLGTGDPNDAVAGAIASRVGTQMLFGGGGSMLGRALQTSKLGSKIMSFAAGLATTGPQAAKEAAEALGEKVLDKKAFEAGKKAFLALTAPLAGAALGAHKGYEEDGVYGAVKRAVEYGIYGSAGQHSLERLAPAMMKIMAAAPHNSSLGQIAADALNHATDVGSGMIKINRAVDNVFKFGGQKAFDASYTHKLREKAQKYLEDGGITEEMQEELYRQHAPLVPRYAEGGEVKKTEAPKTDQPAMTDRVNGMAVVYPEQNMLMSAAKGRVVNYLNALRPAPDQPRLAFDPKPNTDRQKKTYDSATDVAVNPLSILESVRSGTLGKERLMHFKNLHPEIDGLLQRELTKKIVQMQVKGQKPSLKVRQGLSMFLGTPLSSEFKQANIQAAQAVFAQMRGAAAGQPQPGPPPKKSNRVSKLSQSMQTGSQALVARKQQP